MNTVNVICQIICGLDALLAISLLVLRYTKGPSNNVVTGVGIGLFVLALAAMGAAIYLLHTARAMAAIVVALIPLLLALAVVLFVYFLLKNMRLF